MGAGAASRRPLGSLAWRAACCSPSLLTLYITPVIYVYLDRLEAMIARTSGTGKAHAVLPRSRHTE